MSVFYINGKTIRILNLIKDDSKSIEDSRSNFLDILTIVNAAINTKITPIYNAIDTGSSIVRAIVYSSDD